MENDAIQRLGERILSLLYEGIEGELTEMWLISEPCPGCGRRDSGDCEAYWMTPCCDPACTQFDPEPGVEPLPWKS